MKRIRVPYRFGSFGAALAISGLQFLSAMFPCASALANSKNFFDWENLQSDIAGVADRTDPNLVNSWGLALNTNANIFWVADNGSGLSTLYQPDGTLVSLVVTIPRITEPHQLPHLLASSSTHFPTHLYSQTASQQRLFSMGKMGVSQLETAV